MAVPFSNTKLRVPRGFQNILEGLAREILRSQPDDIFQFAAEYFENLLKIRAETGHDPAIHGSRLEDRFYNNSAFKERNSGGDESCQMTEEEAAIKIQAGYRGYVGRMTVRRKKSESNGIPEQDEEGQEKPPTPEEALDINLDDPEVAKAALKIQSGFRGHMARQEIKRKKDEEEIPVSPPPAQEKARLEAKEEIDIDLTDPEVEKAAVKIQAGFKGYKVRKLKTPDGAKAVEDQGEEVAEEEGTSQQATQDELVNDPGKEQAATKIQANYRGYKTRKALSASSQLTNRTDASEEEPATVRSEEQEVVDIDLNDPDVEKAALKIQASFKGFKVRKEMKDSTQSQPALSEVQTEEEGDSQQEEGEKVLPDPAREQAAIKIQAGYRGFVARQEVKSRQEATEQQEVTEAEATADGGEAEVDQEAVGELVSENAAKQEEVDEHDHGEQAVEDVGGEAEPGNEGDGEEQQPSDAGQEGTQDPGLDEEAAAEDELDG